MKQSITAEDVEKISGEVITSDFFKRFGYNRAWISGSSTPVFPIMIWKREINIQLAGQGVSHKGRSAAFRRILRKLRRTYPQITGQFWRSDGSCPDTYTIHFNN